MDAYTDPTWYPSSHGASKFRWGVSRFAGKEWHEDARGRALRFASFEAAQRLADRLNREVD